MSHCQIVVFMTEYLWKGVNPSLCETPICRSIPKRHVSSPPLPANEIAPLPLIPTIHSLFPPPVGQTDRESERRDPHYSAPLNSARRASERVIAPISRNLGDDNPARYTLRLRRVPGHRTATAASRAADRRSDEKSVGCASVCAGRGERAMARMRTTTEKMAVAAKGLREVGKK